MICHEGCGIYNALVLNGEQRGTVWNGREDWAPYVRQDGGQWGFLDWYEGWLEPGAVLGSITTEVWDQADRVGTMLRFAQDKVPERKLRQFAAACCRSKTRAVATG